MASQYLPFLMQHILQSQEEEEETPSPSRPVPGAAILQRQPPQALPPVAPGQVPGVSDPTAAIQQRGFEAAGIPTSGVEQPPSLNNPASQAAFRAALAKEYPATQSPVEKGSLDLSQQATAAMQQSLAEDAKTRTAAPTLKSRLGYEGPEHVGGTAAGGSRGLRAHNKTANLGRKTSYMPSGSSSLLGQDAGPTYRRGTVSSPVIRDEQGNQKEFFSSRPEVARDQKLQRAQQNAAVAQAEAAEEQYRNYGEGEPQPQEQRIIGGIMQGLFDANAKGDLTGEAFRNELMKLLTIVLGKSRFDLADIAYSGYTDSSEEG